MTSSTVDAAAVDDPLAHPEAYRNPLQTCDVVMRGGITSGIVYPRAITQLAAAYRFVNVGGSSAGAIAAAAAAAAEYGRDSTQGESFVKLHALPFQLGQQVEGGVTRVLGFFQPDPPTRATFDLALALLRKRGRTPQLLRTILWLPLLVAIAAVALLVILGAVDAADWPWVAVGLALTPLVALILLVAVVLRFVLSSLDALAGNFFGLCRLGPVDGSDEDLRPLSVWLHRTVRELAGMGEEDGPPLTFGDLWGTDPEAEWNPEKRKLSLELMTTDLTRGRAVRLPVPPDRHAPHDPVESLDLVFERDELGRYFPQEVVEAMWEAAEEVPPEQNAALQTALPGGQFRVFPTGAGLPVVVAVRMSLSFPVLISTIPLWRVDVRKKPTAQRVIFSDGGITSNFPIHFFDGVLPRRPTFGINLTGLEPGPHDKPEDYVVPPPEGSGETHEGARAIVGMAGFATALKDAMQNWSDNGEQRLPGFRDRIVGIELGPGEGGLNLDMDTPTIAKLGARGAAAGAVARDLFQPEAGVPSPSDRWNRHRFIRYRTAMALLDGLMRRYGRAYGEPAAVPSVAYPEIVASGLTDPDYPWPSDTATDQALATSSDWAALDAQWTATGQDLDDANVPLPPSTLRITPRS